MVPQLTWDFKVEVTCAAHGGDGRSLALPGDALLHPTFAKHFDREGTSCLHTTASFQRSEVNGGHAHPMGRTGDVLVSKLDVGDVTSWFSGTVGDFTRSVFHVLTVYVHFTGTLDGQTQAPVTWGTIQTHFRILEFSISFNICNRMK